MGSEMCIRDSSTQGEHEYLIIESATKESEEGDTIILLLVNLSFSCEYYAVSSVSVSAATFLAYMMRIAIRTYADLTVLHSLHCTTGILYCTVLYCTMLFCAVLHRTGCT